MPSAVVMLASFNGIDFLEEQVRSINDQCYEKIHLLVSDDGSSDGTLEYLGDLAGRWKKGEFNKINGPNLGFAENYRHLILNSADDADIYAFCDQDDIWMSYKLTKAAEWLSEAGDDMPALFCSRTETIDEHGKVVGLSPLFAAPPTFANAIVQSIAGGNTMVFNRAARDLLYETCKRTGFVSHDWWAYLIVSGAGGKVCYSSAPYVRYRQHTSNLVGANTSWQARMTRLLLMAGGRFAKWNKQNLQALKLCQDLLSDEACQTIAEFEMIRRDRLISRLVRLLKSGIHRQTKLGQISLYGACLLRKV